LFPKWLESAEGDLSLLMQMDQLFGKSIES